MNNTLLIVGSTIVALFMATAMIVVRVKSSRKPTSVKRIILPPIMMSTGAFMFILPLFRVPGIEIIKSLVIGIIFSFLLIKTTKFEIRQQDIYLIPSKAFIFILFGLLIVRLTSKLMMGRTISFGETTGIFFLIAFGMIISWRLAMLFKYYSLKNELMKK